MEYMLKEVNTFMWSFDRWQNKLLSLEDTCAHTKPLTMRRAIQLAVQIQMAEVSCQSSEELNFSF
jgi:hypothetical protein